MKMYKCSMCGEDKPISEYYIAKSGKKAGQRKGAKCKPCYIKVQNERDKVSEAKKAYVEKNKDKIREYNYNRYLAVKDTQEFKDKKMESDKKYRSTDKYKNNAHIRAAQSKELRESKKNHHLIAINKELRKARVRDNQRELEAINMHKYKQIANKYSSDKVEIAKDWRYIDGYYLVYKISNYGEVYSCISNRVIKPILCTTHGYYKVNLYYATERTTYKVHRLVAAAFIPNPECKPQVNHIDSNRLNNIVSNIEWATAQENMDHMACKNRNLIKNVTH